MDGVHPIPGQVDLATDFFLVDTVVGHRLYELFMIEIESRIGHQLGVTANPNGSWMAQMARNLVFDLDGARLDVRSLVRGGDIKFTARLRPRPTHRRHRGDPQVGPSAGSQRLRRTLQTLTAGCLDHLVIVSTGQLEPVLYIYVRHCSMCRWPIHLPSLTKTTDTPASCGSSGALLSPRCPRFRVRVPVSASLPDPPARPLWMGRHSGLVVGSSRGVFSQDSSPVGADLARRSAEVAPEVVEGRTSPERVAVVEDANHLWGAFIRRGSPTLGRAPSNVTWFLPE